MYLHIAYDSPFVDHFIKYSNRVTADNTFIIWGTQLKYASGNNVILVKDYNEFKAKGFDAAAYKKIFIHYLNDEACNLILDNKSHGNYYWFFWGADGYGIPELKADFYLPLTTKILAKPTPLKKQVKQVLAKISNAGKHSKIYQALQCIQYCCTWVTGDFELIKRLNNKLQLYFFSYLSADELLGKENEEAIETTDISAELPLTILAGNSLNSTNNHLDIIQYLNKIKLPAREIILPLSYSGADEYKVAVKAAATKNLGSKAVFIDDFLPLNEYLQLLKKCDIAVFFHLRQQGANNALSLLWMGKIVVMNSRSTLYTTFKQWGLSVIDADDIKSIDDLIAFHQANKDRLTANRKILMNIFAQDKVEGYYKSLF